MMIVVLQLRAVPRLYRLPDPETEQLQQLRGLRVQHRRQGDGSLPQAVQEDGPRGHLDTLLIQRYSVDTSMYVDIMVGTHRIRC